MKTKEQTSQLMLKYQEVPPEIRNKKWMATVTTFIHHHDGDARLCKKGRKRKSTRIEKEERQFAYKIIAYVETPKESINKLLKLINDLTRSHNTMSIYY